MDTTSVKQHQKDFSKCTKRSGRDSSLLLSFSSGGGSAAVKINRWRERLCFWSSGCPPLQKTDS